MAYFPNGTSGMMYEEAFCNRCIHNADPEKGCAVWGLHLDWNYDQCKDTPEGKTKKAALEHFIPDDVKEGYSKCAMYVNADSTLIVDVLESLIVDVRCVRCDRVFRSLKSVKYCSSDCELGVVNVPK